MNNFQRDLADVLDKTKPLTQTLRNTQGWQPVILFQLMSWSGHPQQYLFLSRNVMFSGSHNLKNIQFAFENRIIVGAWAEPSIIAALFQQYPIYFIRIFFCLYHKIVCVLDPNISRVDILLLKTKSLMVQEPLPAFIAAPYASHKYAIHS